jgi:catalase (peroxidase I)
VCHNSGPDPEGEMPEETLSASALKQSFHGKGFTTQELVVLSGAHTLGAKGFGNPNLFDNSYFQILLQKPWKAPGMCLCCSQVSSQLSDVAPSGLETFCCQITSFKIHSVYLYLRMQDVDLNFSA